MTTPTQNGHNGHHQPQHRWEISNIRRVSSEPVAWRGKTVDGYTVHVSYFHGLLRIEVAEPSAAHPGSFSWRDLLVVRPDYIELELDLLQQRKALFGEGVIGSIDVVRRERRALADWFALGECKSDRRTKTPRMTFWRLRTLLQSREENLVYLQRAGIAGAPVRLILTTLGEE